jgi:hypothetical protein
VHEPERAGHGFERELHGRMVGGLLLEKTEGAANGFESDRAARRGGGAAGSFDLKERAHGVRHRLRDRHELRGNAGVGLNGAESTCK